MSLFYILKAEDLEAALAFIRNRVESWEANSRNPENRGYIKAKELLSEVELCEKDQSTILNKTRAYLYLQSEINWHQQRQFLR